MLKHVIVTFVVLLVFDIVAALVFISSGWYDVSVANRDTGITGWVLESTMENSVEAHAKDIKVPALDDKARIMEGLEHYSHMCVFCHGAPGRDNNRAAKRYNPAPPPLMKAARDWKDNELFWIVKHGVKMSAMPAFGTTHDDEHIWDIVAFLKVMPSMKPQEYQQLLQNLKNEPHDD